MAAVKMFTPRETVYLKNGHSTLEYSEGVTELVSAGSSMSYEEAEKLKLPELFEKDNAQHVKDAQAHNAPLQVAADAKEAKKAAAKK